MATAADILGAKRRPKIPSMWAENYKQLCVERDRLMARDFSTGANSTTKTDELAEAAAEESQRSMTLVEESATQAILSEIIEAIRRIERGAYGICEATGAPIESDRLEAIPWARYSLKGQTDMEKNGLSRRTGLPMLQSLVETNVTVEDNEGAEEAA